jgi:hypothetical protein
MDELRMRVRLSVCIPPPVPFWFSLTVAEVKVTRPSLLLIPPATPCPAFPFTVEEFTVKVPWFKMPAPSNVTVATATVAPGEILDPPGAKIGAVAHCRGFSQHYGV